LGTETTAGLAVISSGSTLVIVRSLTSLSVELEYSRFNEILSLNSNCDWEFVDVSIGWNIGFDEFNRDELFDDDDARLDELGFDVLNGTALLVLTVLGLILPKPMLIANWSIPWRAIGIEFVEEIETESIESSK